MSTVSAIRFNQLPDEDLMELFQGGYDEAYSIIVTRYRERIHQFIFRYTKNHLDSEDLVQETFLRVFRSRNSYERIARFSTWLYTIAQNLIRSQYKKNQRMQTISLAQTDDQDQEITMELPDTALPTDQQVHLSMTVMQVRKALASIPSDFRDVLVMRDIDQLTYEEIMDITKLPMGTVKSRINRGRARLHEVMGTYADF
jgi:RNA polymerase sigma-70 factor (ECF subfamily)